MNRPESKNASASGKGRRKSGGVANVDQVAQKRFLHVGCGPAAQKDTAVCFRGSDWEEVRYDIDPSANPHILGTMLDMSVVPTGSFDAVYSAHNIEHLYPHQVVPALREFLRVLKPDGFVVITCPDLKAVCKRVAETDLMAPAYYYPGGSVTPHEILYGLGPELARDNLYMAHHCGFTLGLLFERLGEAGFQAFAGYEHDPFALTVVARKDFLAQKDITAFAKLVLGL